MPSLPGTTRHPGRPFRSLLPGGFTPSLLLAPKPLAGAPTGPSTSNDLRAGMCSSLQGLQLSPVKLSELHADLKMQERDEFAWKKLKAEGLDEDGEKQAKLTRSLSVILAKYGLDGRKDTRAMSSNSLSDPAEEDSLEDPRLEKLWHKAKTSGKFSSEELDKLRREFQHHKEKVREYNVLLETLSRTEGAPPLQAALGGPPSTLTLAVSSGHLGITGRCHTVTGTAFAFLPEFEEPRVIDLWDLAKSANFTEKELESFREELKHFEAKIEKHNHYQKQLEISHQKLKHVESFGDREHVSRNKEKYAMLEEKTMVKKHLQDLSGRISRARHQEL
uniref:LDL receptor related protein associated protein 1 n=1 Tax=Ursus maritimus TaxID=29073 RepID=A0A452TXW9_URSMA